MAFYGLIELRPKDRKERKYFKDIIEIAYQGEVKPVPRDLRKDFAEETNTFFDRNQLVWLIKFPSNRGYYALMNKMEKFKINGIFPITEIPPEIILKLRHYHYEK